MERREASCLFSSGLVIFGLGIGFGLIILLGLGSGLFFLIIFFGFGFGVLFDVFVEADDISLDDHVDGAGVGHLAQVAVGSGNVLDELPVLEVGLVDKGVEGLLRVSGEHPAATAEGLVLDGLARSSDSAHGTGGASDLPGHLVVGALVAVSIVTTRANGAGGSGITSGATGTTVSIGAILSVGSGGASLALGATGSLGSGFAFAIGAGGTNGATGALGSTRTAVTTLTNLTLRSGGSGGSLSTIFTIFTGAAGGSDGATRTLGSHSALAGDGGGRGHVINGHLIKINLGLAEGSLVVGHAGGVSLADDPGLEGARGLAAFLVDKGHAALGANAGRDAATLPDSPGVAVLGTLASAHLGEPGQSQLGAETTGTGTDSGAHVVDAHVHGHGAGAVLVDVVDPAHSLGKGDTVAADADGAGIGASHGGGLVAALQLLGGVGAAPSVGRVSAHNSDPAGPVDLAGAVPVGVVDPADSLL
mmetsp:Transcript_109646/g.153576  ORF Transcript_109646/g.153576 Transcript_109646/m.153576 type:complete len:476 (-) Transcript_109646:359-1786(-)